MKLIRSMQVFVAGVVLLLCTACSGLHNMAKDMAEVQKEGDAFIDALTSHNWQDARALLTKSGQEKWDEKKLTDYWAAFETVHGPVKRRTVVGFRAFTGTTGQSVTYNYEVDGKERDGGMVSMKLLFINGHWLIDELALQL